MDWSGEYQRSKDLVPQADEIDEYPRLERSLAQIDALARSLAARVPGAGEAAGAAAAGVASGVADRVLAREGFDSERLRRDVRGLELQTTFEDVFPVEHTSLEKYLESVHQSVVSSALLTAEQRLLKDYDDFVEARLQDLLEEDKRKLMQAYGRVAMGADGADASAAFGEAMKGVSHGAAGSGSALGGGAGAYAAVAKAMNDARDQRRQYDAAAMLAKAAREHGSSQAAHYVYDVLSSVLGEGSPPAGSASGAMLLVRGARAWLERGQDKLMLDWANRYREQAGLGGVGGGLARVHAFLRVNASHGGVGHGSDLQRMDFEGGAGSSVDTTWERLFLLVRSGYATEAAELADELRGSAGGETVQWLREWAAGGAASVSVSSATAAASAADKLLAERAAARSSAALVPYGAAASAGGANAQAAPRGTREHLLLLAVLAGDRGIASRVEGELQAMGQSFENIEDYMWFKLACVRSADSDAVAPQSPSPSLVATGGLREECTLASLCQQLALVPDDHYTKTGTEPLLFVMVLLLTQQFTKALDVLRSEAVSKAFPLEAPHVAAVLAHRHPVAALSAGAGAACAGALDGWAVAAAGADHDDVAIEYAALAAAAEAATHNSGEAGANRFEFREAWGERLKERSALGENEALARRARHLLRRSGKLSKLLPRGKLESSSALSARLGGEERARQCVAAAASDAETDGSYSKALDLYRAAGEYANALALANHAAADALSGASRRAAVASQRTATAGGSADDALRLGGTIIAEADAHGTPSPKLSAEEDALKTLKAAQQLLDASARNDNRTALAALHNLPLPLEPFRADSAAARVPELHAAVKSLLPDLLLAAARALHDEAGRRAASSDAGRVTRTQLEAIRAFAARAPLDMSPAAHAQLAMYTAPL